MAESSILRPSFYFTRQDSPPSSPSKPSGLHDLLSSTRSKAPVKLRKLEGERNMHTEIRISPLQSPNSSLQAAKLPNITQIDRRSKRTQSNLNPNMVRESGKSRMDVKYDKVIHLSKVVSFQTEEKSGSSPNRKSRIGLTPIEIKMKKNASTTNYDRNRSCLSPESLERIGEHLNQGSPVNRDIANVLEPIALKNSQKIKTVNKIFSDKDGGMGNSPKTKFEEEILDALKKRFVQDKLDTDLRVIKPMHSEKFVLASNKEAYFKLSTKNLRFPLQGRILTKAPSSAYEIFASTRTAKPHLANCDQCFVGREFFIEIQPKVKVEWIYFTLSAFADIEIKLWILPEAGRKNTEDDESPVVNKVVRKSPIQVVKPESPDNKKAKHSRLYSFGSYSQEQLEKLEEETKHQQTEKEPKIERDIQTRNLAREEKNTIVSNIDGIKNFNKELLIDKIREFNRLKTESQAAMQKQNKIICDDKIRKFLINKRFAVKHEYVPRDFSEEAKIEEVKNERRILWAGAICENFVLHALAKRIWEAKASRLLNKIRNRSALLIQRAYERYIFRKGNNKILRHTVDIRESLCFISHMISDQAHKKAAKVAKTFLAEFPLLQMIAIKAKKFEASVRKIQKIVKRHCLARRFQRSALNLMIQDIASQSSDEPPTEDLEQVKVEKKVEKIGRMKSKSVGKPQFNFRDPLNVAKQNKALRVQFDKALLTSLEFRNIVIEAYLEEIIRQKKQGFVEERRKQLYKLPQCTIQETDDMEICETLEDLKADQLKETWCTLAKTSSTASQGSKNPLLDTKESSLVDSKLTSSLKLGASLVHVKMFSKEGLAAFMDEKYIQIAKKARVEGHSKLLWLFN